MSVVSLPASYYDERLVRAKPTVIGGDGGHYKEICGKTGGDGDYTYINVENMNFLNDIQSTAF